MTLHLSHAQRAVVEHTEGPLLVLAGPGSGKTRVLTERVRTLLSTPGMHFKVLALTFSNKAANEMAERLADFRDLQQRATISTIHGFCLELLSDRGKAIGVASQPQIFERMQDRRMVLAAAVQADPLLSQQLTSAGDPRQQQFRLNDWLDAISQIKAHPLTGVPEEGSFEQHLLQAYNSELAASNAFDFDDLLLLARRLLTEVPKVADLYRRIYRYICIDEAQDLNEAQYAVITALCGDQFNNVMMVGDPKQSIYGFNTSSPMYMENFLSTFGAREITLTENYRSSQMVVRAAQSLIPEYTVEGQLPVSGAVRMLVGNDEGDEARLVADEIERLIEHGHPDVEGPISPGSFAILGRNRYCIAAVERELGRREISYYRRLSATHEYESDLVQEFLLGLRVMANPADRFHLNALLRAWELSEGSIAAAATPLEIVESLCSAAAGILEGRCSAVVAALQAIVSADGFRLHSAVEPLRGYANGRSDEERSDIYNDLGVMVAEWDQYLRRTPSGRSLGGFLSAMALGATQQPNANGVALMTVHASKGLEFDVVFLAGMAEGIFPDYRARTAAALREELRNAFVAVTRSKRLLYVSYPKVRLMPWGDYRATEPSRYLKSIAQVG